MARTKLATTARTSLMTKTAHKGAFVPPAGATARAPPVLSSGSSGKEIQKGKKGPSKGTSKKRSSNNINQQGLKKIRRFRPGTVALREIRKQQRSVKTIIPKAPFIRLVRECMGELQQSSTPGPSGTGHSQGVRLRSEALLCMREGVEALTTRLLENANLASIHGKRVTVMPKDLAVIRRITSNN